MSLTVEKCLQAWTNSLRQMNAKADIVFFGDSLTYYGDFPSAFPDKVVCNLGLRGDTIQGMIDRVVQVKLLNPRIVLLMAGINDVARCSIDEFRDLYWRLLLALIDAVPECELIVQNILPVNNKNFSVSCNNEMIRDCNQIIESLAFLCRLRVMDLYSIYSDNELLPKDLTFDGIHLFPSSYYKWFDALKLFS